MAGLNRCRKFLHFLHKDVKSRENTVQPCIILYQYFVWHALCPNQKKYDVWQSEASEPRKWTASCPCWIQFLK